ncbi:hypothetical protein SteCoe_34253 [Stentor coeruleus]|uniref:Kinesin-like protein n=1 Tax=Stentor coeruleus TaxID=5963 RepID=A0A1R2AUX2_9CILI|nr:hypothetical protein SteCoe_34253 [Stentor coeruleus]
MEDQTNIRVVCRFRPLNDMESQRSQVLCVNFLSDQTVSINSQNDFSENLKFTLDKVFSPDSSQESVYNFAAKPIVEGVMQGFNGTVFAYGQTSSGKTFTMAGPSLEDPIAMGIIPRMVNTVFESIYKADSNTEFTVKISYCEIYMEKIKDLLNPCEMNLKIHEDKFKGVYIEGIKEVHAGNDNEVYELMKTGSDNREVAYTNMNAVSSRSHSLFIITISQTNSKDHSAKIGKLFLVDLAGSEKVGKTGAAGLRLEEAKHINKSLTALGQVIYSLTDGKSTHIPYRDSKLTRVLQDSLGGNSKTSLIVTCSPSPYNESETISSLRFGVRAKTIKNKPKINREYTVAELKLLLAKSKEEIDKRDKIITRLEDKLKGQGDSLFDFTTSFSSLGEKIDADDIMDEINDLKIRLEEEIDINNQFKQANDKLIFDLADIKSDHAMISQELKDAEQRMSLAEKSVKEQEVFIQKLVMTNDSLEKKLECETKNKIALERIVSEKEYEITQLKQEILMKDNKDQKKIMTRNMISLEEHEELKNQISKLKMELEHAKELKEIMVNDFMRALDDSQQLKDKQASRNCRTGTYEVVSPEIKNLNEEIDELKKLLRQSQAAEYRKSRVLEIPIEFINLKEENEKLKLKVLDLQRTINEILTSTPSEVKTQDNIILQMMMEKEKACFEKLRKSWETEKENIMRNLENRCKKVIELETNLDMAKDSYRNLEENIGKNERTLIMSIQRKDNYLSKLAADLQRELIIKQKIENNCQFYEKMLKDQEEKMKILENECEEFRKKEIRLEFKLKNAEEEAISSMGNKRGQMMNFGNIRKPIKGGSNNDLRKSIVIENINDVGK